MTSLTNVGADRMRWVAETFASRFIANMLYEQADPKLGNYVLNTMKELADYSSLDSEQLVLLDWYGDRLMKRHGYFEKGGADPALVTVDDGYEAIAMFDIFKKPGLIHIISPSIPIKSPIPGLTAPPNMVVMAACSALKQAVDAADKAYSAAFVRWARCTSNPPVAPSGPAGPGGGGGSGGPAPLFTQNATGTAQTLPSPQSSDPCKKEREAKNRAGDTLVMLQDTYDMMGC